MPSPREDYDERGYHVFRGLIPPAAVAALLGEYQRVLARSPEYLYRQSNRFERNRLTAHGYVANSFLHVHSYDHPPKKGAPYSAFARAAREIVCGPEVTSALVELTGRVPHRLMQSMLFDMNMATEPHQDYYFLDSVPEGRLLAGWFALEDIHADSGRFFVLPGSQRVHFRLTDDERAVNKIYLRRLEAYVKTHADRIHAPALRRGDVLFWNSKTIHGSLPTRDRRWSRKSLTAHYLPDGHEFGRLGVPYDWQLRFLRHREMDYWLFGAAGHVPPPLWTRMRRELRVQLFSFGAQPELYRAARLARAITGAVKARLGR